MTLPGPSRSLSTDPPEPVLAPSRRSPRMPLRRAGVAALSALALAVWGLSSTVLAPVASAAKVGAGSYTSTLPPGAGLPTGCGAVSTNPRGNVTVNAPKGAVPTNDWWSSILFKKTDCQFGEPMMAHPAGYDTYPGGLGISYASTPVITGTATGVGEYKFPYSRDVLVGVAGMAAGRVAVDGWTDWTVTPSWTDGSKSLKATIGHGLPMSYYEVAGGQALLSTDGTPRVWLRSGNRVGFSIRGHDYVAYAPSKATWRVSGNRISSSLAGKKYLTVAVLPTAAADKDSTRKAFAATYGRYAYAAVTGTKVSYRYDQASSTVSTTYAFTTKKREGKEARTVVSLYPHQWKALAGGKPLGHTYISPRGAMKTLAGVSSFTTRMTYSGVLPEVPAVADSSGADAATLNGYLDQVAADPAGEVKDDTYWAGKGLGRAARVAEIADQVGKTPVRDKALAQIKATLTNWLTASAGETSHLFYYDKNWGTLIGYPASYGSDAELNDHHFHYGYFVAAAATLAKFDPAWATSSQYGGMLDLLIRDANNYDRSDTRFPYLRDFDIYAGHDWASGHGSFAAGNNQESSSEGMNFDGALIQWGQATGNTKVRDAGIWMYTTQAAAIDDYWFDVDGTTFPKTFAHSTVGMVWGDGAAYSTWFSADPEKIQGINQLPVTGNHFYLGANPAYVRKNYAEMEKNSGGPKAWQDILWEYLALGNGPAALSKLKANPGFTPEEGESPAHTFHWIRNLAALGTIDTKVRADNPMAVTFTKNGRRTHVAANLSTKAITVTFSDGAKVAVPAGKTVASGAQNWSGGHAGATGGGTSPTPTPTPSPTGSPSPTPKPTASATTLSFSAAGTLGAKGSTGTTVRLAAADGQHDGTPTRAAVFTARGLTGRSTGGSTAFDLAVDAGTTVGNAAQVRVSYDLTGNGSWDRVETYRYFATNDVPGFEHYTQKVGLGSSTGALGAFAGGQVRVEVWNAIGVAPTTLGTGNRSTLTLPIG